MPSTKDYAFASGGIIWKIFDRPKFESRSLKQQVYIVFGLMFICWLPIAVLSLLKLGLDQFYLLFIRDIATHVRFLVVLPLLIFARRSVNISFDQAIGFFYDTKIVDKTNAAEFEQVMDKLEKWKNSKFIDYGLIFLVYLAFFIQEKSRFNNASVYAPWHIVDSNITAAGWWYLVISLPILQLLLYRWAYTTLLWIVFLRKISKLNLHLSSLHPDGVGGLGFLQYTQLSFFPVALAFSALVAGVMNNLIIFSGISIMDYRIAFGSVVLIILLLFILPLLSLMPLLAKVKRSNYMQYSLQSWPITRKYDGELEDYYKTEEEHPDTSWHVDLIGSFEKTRDMKIILVDKTILIAFAAAVIIPFLPVLAQQVPLKEIFINLFEKVLG
jgi:hypothetical protein